MLLTKHEKDGVINSLYSSSNICASAYEKTEKKLIITFSNGGQYLYEDVSFTDYTRFEMADSQGSVVNSHIKKYSFKNLGKVNTKDILDLINVLKEAESKALVIHTAKTMIGLIKSVSTYYDSTDKIEPNMLASLKNAIKDYEDKLTISK